MTVNTETSFLGGAIAARSGKPHTANPYIYGTTDWINWMNGWVRFTSPEKDSKDD